MSVPPPGRHARRLGTAIFVVVLVGALTLGGIGSVAAGDRVAIISTEPATITAQPGDEFTVDVVLYGEGSHDGSGASSVTLAAQYHPEYLEITDVERGPWIEQDEETDVYATQTLAHEQGTALSTQWRDPVAGGATGMARIATLTVSVAPDAPPGETAIAFGESEIELATDWPMPVVGESATVVIDGGETELESFDHPPVDSLSADANATTADENSDADTTTGPLDALSNSVPELGVGFVIAFGLVVLAVRTVRSD
ncbi:hypothetical protein [Natrialba aegyptia]|uniref:hypothetical protein n=1 Tax=Natrialba aegyptia TaxID=129789 RepID=UPI00267AEA27